MKTLIVSLVLSVSSVAVAADAPKASVPADMKCATAKRTVIDADGTIHIKTVTVCK